MQLLQLVSCGWLHRRRGHGARALWCPCCCRSRRQCRICWLHRRRAACCVLHAWLLHCQLLLLLLAACRLRHRRPRALLVFSQQQLLVVLLHRWQLQRIQPSTRPLLLLPSQPVVKIEHQALQIEVLQHRLRSSCP